MSETAALEALAELVNTGAYMRKRAGRLELVGVWLSLAGIVSTLDAAYVTLEDVGERYLDTAWAFIDSGRAALAHWQIVLDDAEW